MNARRKARMKAFEILFEAYQRDIDPNVLLDERDAKRDPRDTPPNAYIALMVRGVTSRRADIDQAITRRAQSWRLERMSGVDRTILRMGTWELMTQEAPTGVVLSEAVALTKMFSTDKAVKFINGVLGKVGDDLRGSVHLDARRPGEPQADAPDAPAEGAARGGSVQDTPGHETPDSADSAPQARP